MDDQIYELPTNVLPYAVRNSVWLTHSVQVSAKKLAFQALSGPAGFTSDHTPFIPPGQQPYIGDPGLSESCHANITLLLVGQGQTLGTWGQRAALGSLPLCWPF